MWVPFIYIYIYIRVIMKFSNLKGNMSLNFGQVTNIDFNSTDKRYWPSILFEFKPYFESI